MNEEKSKEYQKPVNWRSSGATPFDDAFKTEVARLKQLLVPLINELYGTDYDSNVVEITREANEHYLMTDINEESRKVPHRITDSCICLGGKLYNVECQSTEDGSILIRLVEYNMQIGLENIQTDKDTGNLTVELPNSALIMLRSGGPGLPKIGNSRIVYRHNEQEIQMEVPVLHVQSYTPDEIYEKKLYFLIPFYAIRYEKQFEEIARKSACFEKNTEETSEIRLEIRQECDTIVSELSQWFERLNNAYENNEITSDEIWKLSDLSRVILNHITRRLDHEASERIVNTMGGKIIELPGDKLLREAYIKGRSDEKHDNEKNIEETKQQIASNLLLDGYPPEKASSTTGLSMETILELARHMQGQGSTQTVVVTA